MPLKYKEKDILNSGEATTLTSYGYVSDNEHKISLKISKYIHYNTPFNVSRFLVYKLSVIVQVRKKGLHYILGLQVPLTVSPEHIHCYNLKFDYSTRYTNRKLHHLDFLKITGRREVRSLALSSF